MQIDNENLKQKIRHSGDFTAMEKRYLENLVMLAEMPYVTMRVDEIPDELKEFMKNTKITPGVIAGFDPKMITELLSVVADLNGGEQNA